MIQLHPDYLLIQTATGETIPCSAELITVELMGETAALVDPEIIRQAASAVLHYFKHDLGRTFVSVGEFSKALTRVLEGLGFTVQKEAEGPDGEIDTADLRDLACDSGKGFELAFFPQLRDELQQRLRSGPDILRLKGLRGCVKLLTGSKRWNNRCQQLSDQIVSYVRHCLASGEKNNSCKVVIQ